MTVYMRSLWVLFQRQQQFKQFAYLHGAIQQKQEGQCCESKEKDTNAKGVFQKAVRGKKEKATERWEKIRRAFRSETSRRKHRPCHNLWFIYVYLNCAVVPDFVSTCSTSFSICGHTRYWAECGANALTGCTCLKEHVLIWLPANVNLYYFSNHWFINYWLTGYLFPEITGFGVLVH